MDVRSVACSARTHGGGGTSSRQPAQFIGDDWPADEGALERRRVVVHFDVLGGEVDYVMPRVLATLVVT